MSQYPTQLFHNTYEIKDDIVYTTAMRKNSNDAWLGYDTGYLTPGPSPGMRYSVVREGVNEEQNTSLTMEPSTAFPINDAIASPLTRKNSHTPRKQEKTPFLGDIKYSHPCSTCYKSFKRAAELQRHLESHLSVKPYWCMVCGKGFTRRDSLGRHCAKFH